MEVAHIDGAVVVEVTGLDGVDLEVAVAVSLEGDLRGLGVGWGDSGEDEQAGEKAGHGESHRESMVAMIGPTSRWDGRRAP